jgi:hypothetical protein
MMSQVQGATCHTPLSTVSQTEAGQVLIKPAANALEAAVFIPVTAETISEYLTSGNKS